jgi:predicted PurR-regulated permease PerM
MDAPEGSGCGKRYARAMADPDPSKKNAQTPEELIHGNGLTEAQLWFHYTRYPYLLAKIATFALGIAIVYWAFTAIEAVLFPVLVSLLIAYLLDPAIDKLEERGWSRTRAIMVLIGIGVGVGTLFVLFLYPTIAHAIQKMTLGGPKLFEMIQSKGIPWVEAQTGAQVPDTLSQAMADYGETVKAQLPGVMASVSEGAAEMWTRTGAIVASLLNIVMIPVFTFYFLRDFDTMRHATVEYIPKGNREWILVRLQRMDVVVGAWFRGQIEVAAILAGLYATGLAIVFGVTGMGITSGIAIGLLAGILNIIPYFGFLIGFVLSMGMVVLDWSLGGLVGVLLVFGVVQGLEGYVITPKIVGDKVGLSPIIVIIALLIGGELLGLLGVLLALPIAGIIRVLMPDITDYYQGSGFYTGDFDGAVATPPEPTKPTKPTKP